MSAIAIIAPDGNRVVGLRAEVPLAELQKSIFGKDVPGIERTEYVEMGGDWPFQFDKVYACEGIRWRCYDPDDLPMKWW